MKISIIVAKAENNVIGKDNQLIWKLSSDLKLFKKITTGHHIVMGRKTYESVGKPLPNRTSIVITRNPDFTLPKNHIVTHSLEQAIQYCIGNRISQVFIIGGAEIYKQAMPLVDELLVTEVHAAPDGDVYFPEIYDAVWKKESEEFFPKNENNEYSFNFVVYKRKRK